MNERDAIIEELSVKLNTLARKYRELRTEASKTEQTVSMLREENVLLRTTIHNMKTAKLFSLNGQDIKATRREINTLIGEVDRCIALLSV